METKDTMVLATVLLFILCVAWFAGISEQTVAESSDAMYCEMVTLYKQDSARGIKEDDKRGWPDFKGEWHNCSKMRALGASYTLEYR